MVPKVKAIRKGKASSSQERVPCVIPVPSSVNNLLAGKGRAEQGLGRRKHVRPSLFFPCSCRNGPASLTALGTMGETPREGKRAQLASAWAKTKPNHKTLLFSAPHQQLEKRKRCIEWDPNKDESLSRHLGKKVNLSCWTGGRLEGNYPTKMHTQLLSSGPEHETFEPDP